jgi:hypothetical protein
LTNVIDAAQSNSPFVNRGEAFLKKISLEDDPRDIEQSRLFSATGGWAKAARAPRDGNRYMLLRRSQPRRRQRLVDPAGRISARASAEMKRPL